MRALALALALPFVVHAPALASGPGQDPLSAHFEVPDDPYLAIPEAEQRRGPAGRVTTGPHVSVQVNVDAEGLNILGDAANETSIAVDPTDPSRIVIGWRQFDSVASSFRQAGVGVSGDGGRGWTAGVLDAGVFRSDPVLAADSQGRFHYYSLSTGGGLTCETFTSTDGGGSWGEPVFAFGGDKAWLVVDPGPSEGEGHLYGAWSTIGCCGTNQFNRSTDRGASFEMPVGVPEQPVWGVNAIGPRGEVYVVGRRSQNLGELVITRSDTASDAQATPSFGFSAAIDLGGAMMVSSGPNPGGLLGQVWVAVDRSETPSRGHVYVLASVDPPGPDPLDVHFIRSEDGGATWSAPVRVNDDPGEAAWQWFGTLAVAPDGRLDAVWNDTREADPNVGSGFSSRLTYASSTDGGRTWSPNEALSPPFDPHLGFPQQQKIGDYYDMVSDLGGAHIAYAATFNGEEDVYYLRLDLSATVFTDGFERGELGAWDDFSTQPEPPQGQ